MPFPAIANNARLKLSPAGVVPQRERCPCIILDYSYPHHGNVNESSLPVAPMHGMQFGNAFHCLMQRLVYCNPQFGLPLMAKLDLADGYYRIPLSPLAALELAVVLPGDRPFPLLIGIPLSLPMGWTHSPPYFCSYTETVADIANTTLTHPHLPIHPLEQALQNSTTPCNTQFTPSALQPMALAQPPCHIQTMRSLLHSVDAIFFDTPVPSVWRNIISTSKLDKGNGTWRTKKTLLGWNIDSATMTLMLPPPSTATPSRPIHGNGTSAQSLPEKMAAAPGGNSEAWP